MVSTILYIRFLIYFEKLLKTYWCPWYFLTSRFIFKNDQKLPCWCPKSFFFLLSNLLWKITETSLRGAMVFAFLTYFETLAVVLFWKNTMNHYGCGCFLNFASMENYQTLLRVSMNHFYWFVLEKYRNSSFSKKKKQKKRKLNYGWRRLVFLGGFILLLENDRKLKDTEMSSCQWSLVSCWKITKYS